MTNNILLLAGIRFTTYIPNTIPCLFLSLCLEQKATQPKSPDVHPEDPKR